MKNLFCICLWAMVPALLFAQDWSLAKDKNNVQVYTRSVAGESMKEYRVQTVLNTTVDKVVEVVMDWDHYKGWMQDCMEARLLKRESATKTIGYYAIDAPWPVGDRDIANSLEIRKAEGATFIDIVCLPTYIAANKDRVRLNRMKGFWKITELGDGKVKVEQQIWADPGGSIPAWLANATVTDTPFSTFSNLRKKFGQ